MLSLSSIGPASESEISLRKLPSNKELQCLWARGMFAIFRKGAGTAPWIIS